MSSLADFMNMETMNVPSQQSTPVRGTGGGLADMVPATVDGMAPAALSEGEFVIDAETVSMIGDGSSEAGARILQQLVQEIRGAKNTSSPTGEQSKGLTEILG